MSEGVEVRIPDIFRLNDWEIRKFILIVLSTLIAYNAIFLADKFLFKIPILLQLLGFVILTFIPGFIILRILRIHNIDRTQNFLLAVGLSLSFIMIYGLFLNTLLPHLGILKPMSSQPLFYAFNVGILALLLTSYLRDRGFKSAPEFLNVNISPLMLFLLLLPFLSIFGAYVMTFYDSNILILILLFLISLTPVAIAFNKIPENLYSPLIFVVSISILYHVNLISTYLWSFDIFPLASSANLVIERGIWNPNMEEYSPLLLIGILAPIYSLLCDLHFIWVFKIIFPFIAAIIPSVLYQAYYGVDFGYSKFGSKVAVLSAFVFVFFFGFFYGMPDKQLGAELFLALILILMTWNPPNTIFMSLIFSFSLITSHYGVSYTFMLILIGALFMIYIIRIKEKRNLLTSNFTLLFSVLAISWYLYVGEGTVFNSIVHIGDHFIASIHEILQPEGRTAPHYLYYEKTTALWLIFRLIHVILQIFIAVGVVKLLICIFRQKLKRFELPFLSLASYLFLLIGYIRGYGMGLDRVLQITLVLLSPLATIGCIFIVQIVKKLIDNRKITESSFSIKIFSIFLAIFFLFNSGFIFEVTNDIVPPYAIALDKDTWKYWNAFSEKEVSGVMWAKENIKEILAVNHRDALVLMPYYEKLRHYYPDIHPYRKNLPHNTYIYIGDLSMMNVKPGEVEDLSKLNRIFDNGGSEAYWKL